MQSDRPPSTQSSRGKLLSALLEPVVLLIAVLTLFVWLLIVVLMLAWSVDPVVERNEYLIALGLFALLAMALLLVGYFDYKAKNQRSSLLGRALHGLFHLADNDRAKSIILGAVLLMTTLLAPMNFLNWRKFLMPRFT